MKNRREFIKKSTFLSLFLAGGKYFSQNKAHIKVDKPVVLATWPHGMPACEKGWQILANKGKAIDAVEQGVMISESDPNVSSVGYGGLPDRDGRVTLDACIMNELGDCGGVACLEHIKNPINVARLVMEKTPHCLLVGEGAQRFAFEQGLKKEDLLTEAARAAWKEWLKTGIYQPVINIENHDTIGMLALDSYGNLSGACTTSGLAWKMHGRVGDSPIIGAGLFVDNKVGAATATGLGEAVIKTCGAHTVVELMRQGRTPQAACKEAVMRIVESNPNAKEMQIGYLALNTKGEYGSFCLQKGFSYAKINSEKEAMIDADFYYK